jgi:Mg-chelatase subunit ChlD
VSWFGLTPARGEYVHLLWAVLGVVALLAVLEVRSRDVMRQFLSPVMARRLTARPTPNLIAVRLVLIALALASGVLALMRPQAPGTTLAVSSSQSAADVIFVLDVSKSMLAEDTAPNRLTRAKVEIAQMVDRLDGNRVGLVAFAGRAAPLCPLTPDRAFFDLVLSGVDTDSIARGGTRIGDAVQVALRAFPKGVGAKLIVLITDGEDHESYPIEAAKAAQAAGVHIVAVGLGSEAGSQIALTDPATGAKTVMMHDGAPVVSRLDGETLRKMALLTEGAYVPAGTAAIDLDSIVDAHVRPIVRDAAARSLREVPAERYPWFVLAALVFLVAALAAGAQIERARR